MSKSPVWLRGLPPFVEAVHDGEGAGGQQLLIVVVVEAVGCRQGKSVANLFDNGGHVTNQYATIVCDVQYQHTATLAVDVARFDVLIT